MSTPLPTKCPACGGELRIRLMRCPACETEVQGEFLFGRLMLLEGEQLNFLEIFIRCRGNLKDVGAQIGISYPTARNRLDALVRAMGLDQEPDDTAFRFDVLRRLKEGVITSEQALSLLQGGRQHD